MQIASRYDSDAEAEVLGWIRDLTGEDVKPGMRNVETQLKNGITLMKYVKVVLTVRIAN